MRIKIHSIWGVLMLAFCTACSRGGVVDASDYGLKEGQDNTPALVNAMEACRAQKAAKLVIPAGVYDLYPDRANEAYRNISNNDDGLKRVVFLLDGMSDFEIDGGGAKFVCHDHMVPFDLRECRRVTLRNFSVDWDAPFYLQAEVVAVDPGQNAFDLKIADECRWEIQGDRLVFSNKHTPETRNWWFMAPPMQQDVVWEQNVNWNIWYDPATKTPVYCDENRTRVSEWNFTLGRRATARDIGDGVVRLTDACDELPQVGWAIVCNGILSKNRLSPAIHVAGSEGVTVEDVTVHHAAGMAFVAEHSRDVTLRRYNVLLPEGSKRLVTTTADASHFVGCSGVVTLEDCVFENMLDDGTNIHGIYAQVRDLVDGHTLGMTLGHSQQQGFEFAREGDRVRLVDAATLRPGAECLTVAGVRRVNESYFEVRFRESVDSLFREGWVAENLSCQPDVVIRGCCVRQNRARGILIATAGKVLVEDNKFLKCTYAGVMTAGDANYWFESGPVSDMTIRRNLFEDQGLAVGNAPVLLVVPELGPEVDTTWYYHRNIRFEENTVNAFSRVLVNARSVDGIVFRNNVINRSGGYPAADADSPAFHFTGCRNVVVEGNKYNWGGDATVECRKCPGVSVKENEHITIPEL